MMRLLKFILNEVKMVVMEITEPKLWINFTIVSGSKKTLIKLVIFHVLILALTLLKSSLNLVL